MGLPLTGTEAERNFEKAVANTPPGMAFTAGSGPKGATCHGCRFWNHGKDGPQYFSGKGAHGGEIKPTPCAKYRSLTCGQTGAPVEHWNEACKYFEANPTPPPLRNKGGLV
jgi:hypothetical protein